MHLLCEAPGNISGSCKDVSLLSQERNSVATELHQQQDLNGRLQRDVERFKNREQLLAKVPNLFVSFAH